jgi:hypothetical protein
MTKATEDIARREEIPLGFWNRVFGKLTNGDTFLSETCPLRLLIGQRTRST